jgi:hypothetical protein
MPIHECDPWRNQYFDGIACPRDVFIPTDDADAFRWNARHRWLYNKLNVAESQGLECAPHGIAPARFPVFSKPIYNLKGMGTGSRTLQSRADYEQHCEPGHMWMTLLQGDHVSSDVAVINGKVQWMRHAVGRVLPRGTFDYWVIEESARPQLETHCARWIAERLADYNGMLNLETIGGRIIEAHLRFADQWPDLYGDGWVDAVVGLYANNAWSYPDHQRRRGYSVVLFGPHSRSYSYPRAEIAAEIRRRPAISSLQLTFHEDRPPAAHAMPPGGFRLAVINAWDLSAARQARADLARCFGIVAPSGDDYDDAVLNQQAWRAHG